MTAALSFGPVIGVEFSPTTDLYETPVWVDITDKVLTTEGIIIQGGRSFELDNFQTGTANFTLLNNDRLFDPFYTSGTYYGDLLPLKKFRLYLDGSPEVDLFTGYCEGWPQVYDEADANATVPISLIDGFEVLAQNELPESFVAAGILDADPVSYWPLNDPSGGSPVATRAGSGTGIMLDKSPNEHHGLYLNTSEYSDSGGRYFDGNASARVIDASARLDVGGAQEFTITGVFAANDQSEDVYLVGQFGDDIQSYWTVMMLDTGEIAFNFGLGNGLAGTYSGTNAIKTVRKFNNGNQRHFACVVSTVPSTYTPYIYIDGAIETTASWTPPTHSFSSAIMIAADSSLNSSFVGRLAEISVHDAQLTDGEIAGIASSVSTDAGAYYATAGNDGETTGARVDTVLDLMGWPAGDRDVDTGLSTLDAADFSDKPDVLSYLQQVADTEAGRLFMNPSGDVRFQDRGTILLGTPQTVSQVTFGDAGASGEIPITTGGIMIEQTRDWIRNSVTATTTDGSEVTDEDATSITAYGSRSHRVDSIARTPDVAYNLAEYIVHRYKDVQTRIPEFTINLGVIPAASDTWTSSDLIAAGTELAIGDLVTVKRSPNGGGNTISLDAHIEGFTHEIRMNSWKVTYRVSLADVKTYAVWGTGEWGTDIWGY